MLKYWLVNDEIAHEFAFKLNGFEFLLDQVIGTWKIEIMEETTEVKTEEIQTSEMKEEEEKQVENEEIVDNDDADSFLNSYVAQKLKSFKFVSKDSKNE